MSGRHLTERREHVAGWIARQTDAKRKELAGQVAVVADFTGFDRNGDAFTLPAGRRLSRTDPIVLKYSASFGELTPIEVALAMKSYVRQLELASDLL